MNSTDKAIIIHALRILIGMMPEGSHIEANFDVDGKKYELTLNEVE